MRQVYLSTIKTGSTITDNETVNQYTLTVKIIDDEKEVFNNTSEIVSEYCKNVVDLIAVGQAANNYFKTEYGELYINNQIVYSLLTISIPITYDDNGESKYYFHCFKGKDNWYMKAQRLIRQHFVQLRLDGQYKKHWRDNRKY